MYRKKILTVLFILSLGLSTFIITQRNTRVNSLETSVINLQYEEETLNLDVTHRYYSDIKLKKGETVYLRIIFNLERILINLSFYCF